MMLVGFGTPAERLSSESWYSGLKIQHLGPTLSQIFGEVNVMMDCHRNEMVQGWLFMAPVPAPARQPTSQPACPPARQPTSAPAPAPAPAPTPQTLTGATSRWNLGDTGDEDRLHGRWEGPTTHPTHPNRSKPTQHHPTTTQPQPTRPHGLHPSLHFISPHPISPGDR
jgi:hypothetical protein